MRNRLKTEGVPGSEIALEVLKPKGLIPPTVADELEALSVDPLAWGNARETSARFIRNGETAVLVRAVTDEQVEFATNILRQYASIGLDTIPLAAEPALVLRTASPARKVGCRRRMAPCYAGSRGARQRRPAFRAIRHFSGAGRSGDHREAARYFSRPPQPNDI